MQSDDKVIGNNWVQQAKDRPTEDITIGTIVVKTLDTKQKLKYETILNNIQTLRTDQQTDTDSLRQEKPRTKPKNLSGAQP